MLTASLLDILRHPRSDRFLLASHRGARWKGAPDNGYQSRASIRRSVDAGVSILELDFRLTKDGHIVVFHDDYLGRCTDIAERDGRSDIYSPFTGQGYSPAVRETKWEDCIEHLRLKDEHGSICATESVLDLDRLLCYLQTDIPDVLISIDFKDKATVERTAYELSRQVGRGQCTIFDRVLWAFDAKWYPEPETLFSSDWYKCLQTAGLVPHLCPVFRPDSAPKYSPLNSVQRYATLPNTIAFQVGLRGPGGELQDVVDWIRDESQRKGLGFFLPAGDIHPKDNVPMRFDLGGMDPWRKTQEHEIICFEEKAKPVPIDHTLPRGLSPKDHDHRYDLALYRSMGFNWAIADMVEELQEVLLAVGVKVQHGLA